MHFLYFPFHLTFPSFPLGKSGLVALLLRREAYVSAGLRLAKVGESPPSPPYFRLTE